jgi:hypothetical protein
MSTAATRVFGIADAATLIGFTGLVIGDATITGDVGTLKKLIANPCSAPPADIRAGTPSIRKMTLTGAYITSPLDQAFLGTEVTLTVEGDETTNTADGGSAAGVTDTLTLTGTCTEFNIKVSKDDWSIASVTVERKGPNPVS